MARFRSLEPPKRWPDASSASRSALGSRGQSGRLPLAIVDGPIHRSVIHVADRAEWAQGFHAEEITRIQRVPVHLQELLSGQQGI